MDDIGEKVAAHHATLAQMNERLGSLDSHMREVREALRDLTTQMHAGFQAQHHRFATVSELRAWVGVLAALIMGSGLLNWLKG